jgi:methionyl-tRNA formyltransferase
LIKNESILKDLINLKRIMIKDLRIIFMGTPHFAVASLDAFIREKTNIVGVVTAPDKPAGRGQEIQQSEVKRYAIKNELNLLQPIKLNDDGFIEEIKSLQPDLIAVVAFRMLPEKLWKLPPLGTINLHASLLPDYRGAAPINWAIINGETVTGLTTFLINKDIDTGNILLQQKIRIEPDDSAGELHDRMMRIGADLLIRTVKELSENQCKPVNQDSLIKEYLKINQAPKIRREDCRIDWNINATSVFNFIRGLSPYPAAFTELVSPENNKFAIKIYKSTVITSQTSTKAGTISTDKKSFLNIDTTDGLLSLLEVQLTGRKKMGISEFLRGFPINDSWKI